MVSTSDALQSTAHSSPFSTLPPELYDTLLSHVPPHLLQRTALSLLQVFPEYGLSNRHLWTHLVVHRAGQVMPLWKKLREEQKKDDGGMIKHVETFCMVCHIGAVVSREGADWPEIMARRCGYPQQVSG